MTDVPKVVVEDRRNSSDVLGLDPETTKPGVHYRWVSANPSRVARHQMKGYRMVTREDGVLPVIPVDNAGDGTVRVGDMILMQCPEESFQARRKAYESEAIRRTGDPKKEVRKKAKKRGIRSFTRLRSEGDEDEE